MPPPTLPLDAPDKKIGTRWRGDPYVIYHAEMAYRQGLLQTPNAGGVQQVLLLGVEFRNKDQEARERRLEMEDRFEADMMLHRPEMWDAWRASKTSREEMDDLGVDDITWVTPESPEEAEALVDDFSAIDRAWKAREENRPVTIQQYLTPDQVDESNG